MKTQLISTKDFLQQHPTLYYGRYKEWHVVCTPNYDICALALNTFPQPERILKRFQKHLLQEIEINLPSNFSLLLVGTPFQQLIWKGLLDIPKGETWSYQKLASHVQKPKAVRAVANAVGANPISPLIPCHRVIRNNMALGGYFWGNEHKLKLLKSEGVEIETLKKISLKR